MIKTFPKQNWTKDTPAVGPQLWPHFSSVRLWFTPMCNMSEVNLWSTPSQHLKTVQKGKTLTRLLFSPVPHINNHLFPCNTHMLNHHQVLLTLAAEVCTSLTHHHHHPGSPRSPLCLNHAVASELVSPHLLSPSSQFIFHVTARITF